MMASGPIVEELIGGLCKVIADDVRESYLCCICLMNLTFAELTIVSVLKHSSSLSVMPTYHLESDETCNERVSASASVSTEAEVACSQPNPNSNSNSLIRILERRIEMPLSTKSRGGTLWRSENVRWGYGVIKNLSKSKVAAAFIAKTCLPNCALENLRQGKGNGNKNSSTTISSSSWTINSLEDFSLSIILNIIQWDDEGITTIAKSKLLEVGAVQVIRPIMMNDGASHRLKATMACIFLDAEWENFVIDGDGGSGVGSMISKLMALVIDTELAVKMITKDSFNARDMFPLHTVTRAFRDLAISAARGELRIDDDEYDEFIGNPSKISAAAEDDGSSSSINRHHLVEYRKSAILATPSNVALCLRVLSDLIIVHSITNSHEGEGKCECKDDCDQSLTNANHCKSFSSSSSSKYITNPVSAEYCIVALETLLPAIMSRVWLSDDTSAATAKRPVPLSSSPFDSAAASKVSNMLHNYIEMVKPPSTSTSSGSDVNGEGSRRAYESAMNVARTIVETVEIVESTSQRMPVLEGAYNEWMQHCSADW